jgi:hypothetical protein
MPIESRREFLKQAGVVVINPFAFIESLIGIETKEKRTQFLNGKFILANHHGLLFVPYPEVFIPDINYAKFLNAGVIRVFATDVNLANFWPKDHWTGENVGKRIAEFAPLIRANGLKLVVALVNNHCPVPGENEKAFGSFDGYTQLTEDFYANFWKGAYSQFVRELITTVTKLKALDTIFAWEIGNELHTPYHPPLFVDFFKGAVKLIRSVDPKTKIAPGTMGINHLDPGKTNSKMGLEFYQYLQKIGSFVTLHDYNRILDDQGNTIFNGDMPIQWDLDLIARCGLRLPYVVEELGYQQSLPPYWEKDQVEKKFDYEMRAIRSLLQNQVWGIGPWAANLDPKWGDGSRGPTSYPGRSIYTNWQSDDWRAKVEKIYQNLPSPP